MTAMEAFERVEQLRSYINLLNEFYIKHSTWNEELGEGNPEALLITDMKDEYFNELCKLTNQLRDVTIELK